MEIIRSWRSLAIVTRMKKMNDHAEVNPQTNKKERKNF